MSGRELMQSGLVIRFLVLWGREGPRGYIRRRRQLARCHALFSVGEEM